MTTTGVTAPKGFSAAGISAGIKASGNRDLALVVNEGPEFAGAAVFTRNKVFAAPVKVSRETAAGGTIKALIVNSGNANACTGAQGYEDAKAMQRLTAEGIGVDPAHVAVCSTGLIGDTLPMDKVEAGIVSSSSNSAMMERVLQMRFGRQIRWRKKPSSRATAGLWGRWERVPA